MQAFNLKKIFTVLFTVLLFVNVEAQQIFKINQYTERNFIDNPAAVGANTVSTAGALFRSQWEGIDGGPKTVLVFGDKYFSSKNTGVGFILYSDKTGPTSRTGGEFDLSYSIKLDGDEKRLMMGLGAQILQFKIDKDKIAQAIAGDPLLASSGSAIKGDASAGIYLRTPKFNIGISAKQIIQPKLNFIKSSSNPEGMLYRHYFLNANYNIKTDEDNTLIPNFELRYQPNAPADYEGGLLLQHKDIFYFGFSVHYKQDYIAFAGVKIDHKFSIGYAYDVYKNPISDFDEGNGAHEIMLRYFFVK